MQKAEEQEEHWRSVVRSKDEQINTLQYKSNGQQVSVLHIYLCLLVLTIISFFSRAFNVSQFQNGEKLKKLSTKVVCNKRYINNSIMIIL